MKKLILTLVAVFYLGISSGAAVHLHYCMGQLVEWGLVSKDPEKCGKCGMKTDTSKDCCKDEAKQLKFQSDQKISQNNFQLKALYVDLGFAPHISEAGYSVATRVAEHPFSKAPPKSPNTPAFIRHCNFRI